MNKLFPFLFLCLIHLNTSFAQDDLSDYSFNHLDTLINGVKIIGAGESTHGTSEFTLLRLELFKYLVVKHDFNVFFLEADYSACQRVNRYIHGEQDSAEEALSEIRLWPWLTHEMIKIIEWCRDYNSKNQNVLCFIGCDMQLVKDDYLELSRILDTSHSNKLDSIFLNLTHSSNISLINQRHKRWIEFKNEIKINSQDYTFIYSSVDQWFESVLNTEIKYNFRDSCMATNMLKYLDSNPYSKGLYFAHNWHVSNTVYTYKTMTPYKTAGAFLKESIHEQYIPIGLLAYDFEFNALSCADGTIRMKEFSLQRKKRNDLEHLFSMKSDNSISTFYSNNIQKIDKYSITDIGAAYEKDCNKFKPRSKRRLKTEMFDVFFYIKKGNPTKLIDSIKMKYT